MELWRQIVGLAVVFGLLGLLAWLVRRTMRPDGSNGKGFAALWRAAGGGQPVMRQLERMRLTPQHSLHLVVVEGRRLLVGCSPGAMALLDKPAPGQAPCTSAPAMRCAAPEIPEGFAS